MAGFDWYADSPKPCSKLCNLSNLQLRFLCPSDIQEVQALCSDWFPIIYPYYWYEEITSNPRFYSLAAVYDGVIIGLIVAEIKAFSELNKEDEDILAPTFGKDTLVAYLLSLGVSQSHRRNGIASVLLDNLISHLTSVDNPHCKALFLHVLTTNSPAIHFYQRHQFKLHAFLPYYYYINGKSKDGFTYVLYVNGGHPPWGTMATRVCKLKHYCKVLAHTDPCAVPVWLWNKMQLMMRWAWPTTWVAMWSSSS
ncbi:hypothetical protein FOCC_FOCC006243 [Frankliniella occidentalis]|nr:hypothetical protein FOCC_FOCC006243 [Frankliniella occidentalis]